MVAFLAALGPLLGALKAGGAAVGGLASGAGKLAASHPGIAKLGLQALGGGLTQQFGGDDAYQMYMQQLLANRQNGSNVIGNPGQLPTN
jgi:hypothetical protein